MTLIAIDKYYQISYTFSYYLGFHMSKEKITVTIEEELVAELDRLARTLKGSRSSLVETAIRAWKKAQMEQELMEGYRAMAKEDRNTAEESLAAGYEALK
jgi:metal-responsive CopG/Arc/MetJ family transcriptional regulator